MRRPLLVLALMLLWPAVGLADFAAGVAAYDRGDFKTALQEWKPLAAQGLASAQNNLGFIYHNGQGVSQDDNEPVKWYRVAAKLRSRPSHVLVRRVQIGLQSLGYNPGPADGLLGRRTSEAVKAFQRNMGLPPTGDVSSELLRLIIGQPSQMKNVLFLSEAAAMLNICFESAAYKKLSAEAGLKLSELDMRLADLAERIANYYNDDALYMTFEVTRVKMSSDPEKKEYSRTKYQYCGNRLFEEMETYVAKSERRLESYFEKAGGAAKKGNWPIAAKRSYIDRCTSSVGSQGLNPTKARQYCFCIAGGMEREFGMKDYRQMMKAEPTRSGSPYDQRLYKVFTSCGPILPQ